VGATTERHLTRKAGNLFTNKLDRKKPKKNTNLGNGGEENYDMMKKTGWLPTGGEFQRIKNLQAGKGNTVNQETQKQREM